ncbi:MAG: RimK family alpha-L-glutamate ligase, partial [Thermoplasmata archaeon]
DLDIVIPRIGRSLTELGYLILKHLATMGVATTMTANALMTARNKFLALQALLKDGVSVPRTIFLGSRLDAEEALRLLPFPAVLKLLTGTQGLGVLRVRDASEAASIVDTLCVLGQTVCIQELIPHPGGDIRIFVVANRAIGSMKRVAALHEWRTNIHLGASPLDFPLDEATELMAVRAARATDLEIAGVDVVSREETSYVLEVNACPGYQGLLKATGVNAAEHMVAYAVEKARRKIPA